MPQTDIAKLLGFNPPAAQPQPAENLQAQPKEEAPKELGTNEKWAQAILAFAPILAGAALGGSRGGAIGAEAGMSGLSALERSKREEEAKKQQAFSQALALSKEQRAEDAAKRVEQRQIEELGISKQKLALEKQRLEKGEVVKPSKLTSEQTASLANFDSAQAQLNGISEQIQKMPEKMGPVAGLRTLIPYETESKAFDARMKLAAQDIGKSLEGGKLTDADIDRYRKMLPNISDTPELAQQKIGILNELIRNKRSAAVSVLQKANYDVENLQQPGVQQRVATKPDLNNIFGIGTNAIAAPVSDRQKRIMELRKQLGK